MVIRVIRGIGEAEHQETVSREIRERRDMKPAAAVGCVDRKRYG
jgi:hypothetical protein